MFVNNNNYSQSFNSFSSSSDEKETTDAKKLNDIKNVNSLKEGSLQRTQKYEDLSGFLSNLQKKTTDQSLSNDLSGGSSKSYSLIRSQKQQDLSNLVKKTNDQIRKNNLSNDSDDTSSNSSTDSISFFSNSDITEGMTHSEDYVLQKTKAHRNLPNYFKNTWSPENKNNLSENVTRSYSSLSSHSSFSDSYPFSPRVGMDDLKDLGDTLKSTELSYQADTPIFISKPLANPLIRANNFKNTFSFSGKSQIAKEKKQEAFNRSLIIDNKSDDWVLKTDNRSGEVILKPEEKQLYDLPNSKMEEEGVKLFDSAINLNLFFELFDGILRTDNTCIHSTSIDAYLTKSKNKPHIEKDHYNDAVHYYIEKIKRKFPGLKDNKCQAGLQLTASILAYKIIGFDENIGLLNEAIVEIIKQLKLDSQSNYDKVEKYIQSREKNLEARGLKISSEEKKEKETLSKHKVGMDKYFKELEEIAQFVKNYAIYESWMLKALNWKTSIPGLVHFTKLNGLEG